MAKTKTPDYIIKREHVEKYPLKRLNEELCKLYIMHKKEKRLSIRALAQHLNSTIDSLESGHQFWKDRANDLYEQNLTAERESESLRQQVKNLEIIIKQNQNNQTAAKVMRSLALKIAQAYDDIPRFFRFLLVPVHVHAKIVAAAEVAGAKGATELLNLKMVDGVAVEQIRKELIAQRKKHKVDIVA